jgi:hypothetical protein
MKDSTLNNAELRDIMIESKFPNFHLEDLKNHYNILEMVITRTPVNSEPFSQEEISYDLVELSTGIFVNKPTLTEFIDVEGHRSIVQLTYNGKPFVSLDSSNSNMLDELFFYIFSILSYHFDPKLNWLGRPVIDFTDGDDFKKKLEDIPDLILRRRGTSNES